MEKKPKSPQVDFSYFQEKKPGKSPQVDFSYFQELYFP